MDVCNEYIYLAGSNIQRHDTYWLCYTYFADQKGIPNNQKGQTTSPVHYLDQLITTTTHNHLQSSSIYPSTLYETKTEYKTWFDKCHMCYVFGQWPWYNDNKPWTRTLTFFLAVPIPFCVFIYWNWKHTIIHSLFNEVIVLSKVQKGISKWAHDLKTEAHRKQIMKKKNKVRGQGHK